MKNTEELLGKFEILVGKYAMAYGNINKENGTATDTEINNVITARNALSRYFLETIKNYDEYIEAIQEASHHDDL